MLKENLSSFVAPELFYEGECSTIYQLNDGRLLKLNSRYLQSLYFMAEVSYENKILDTRAHEVSEIVSPLSAVYADGFCRGYTMEKIAGIDLNQYSDNLNIYERADLEKYARLYCKIEDAIKKANRLGIVMPDLCTCSNIIIDQANKIRFVDYDGMQFGEFDKAVCISSTLGDPNQFVSSSKYSKSILSYTTELDKRSLTLLLFLFIFNKNLNYIDQYIPQLKRKINLKEMFDLIGLKDEIFMNKVASNLSFDREGDYLGTDLLRIANDYRMVVSPLPQENVYAKVLVHK